MPFPTTVGKYDFEAVITPQAVLAYMRERGALPATPPPQAAVICYSAQLMRSVAAGQQTRAHRWPGPRGVMHVLERTGGTVALVGDFGIGAPATGMIVEELIAWGVRDLVIIGGAGTLKQHCPAGSIVVCDQAIRDEGTSHHYLAPGKYALPSPDLTRELANAVQAAGLRCRVGASWTTDAIYRETVQEARRYQREGVCTVEMEAAALFAITAARNARSAAAFVVTDSLAHPHWQPAFDSPGLPATKRQLCDIAVAVLAAQHHQADI